MKCRVVPDGARGEIRCEVQRAENKKARLRSRSFGGQTRDQMIDDGNNLFLFEEVSGHTRRSPR